MGYGVRRNLPLVATLTLTVSVGDHHLLLDTHMLLLHITFLALDLNLLSENNMATILELLLGSCYALELIESSTVQSFL